MNFQGFVNVKSNRVSNACIKLIAFFLSLSCLSGCIFWSPHVYTTTNSNRQLDKSAQLTEKITSFWKWFELHETEISQSKTDKDPILKLLSKKLQDIDPKLMFKLGKTDDTFVRRDTRMEPDLNELAIQSQVCEKSPCVAAKRLVKFARFQNFDPILYNKGDAVLVSNNWMIVLGNHPPAPNPPGLQISTIEVDPDAASFELEPIGDKWRMVIYSDFPQETSINETFTVNNFTNPIDALVEQMVGEYFFENILYDVKCKPRSEAPADAYEIRKAAAEISKRLTAQQLKKMTTIINSNDVSMQSLRFKLRGASSWDSCQRGH